MPPQVCRLTLPADRYYSELDRQARDRGLDVLFDIVANSRLEAADIERERGVILEELRMYRDQPQDYVQNLFEELVWPGHALGRVPGRGARPLPEPSLAAGRDVRAAGPGPAGVGVIDLEHLFG